MSLKKDWVLTQDAFDKLLARFENDRELAAERYEDLRQTLITFFEFRGCRNPEDETDETINRVARRLSEGQEIDSSTVETYFYAVARNVWRERLAEPHRIISSLDELSNVQMPRASDSEHKTAENELFEKRHECLERCLEMLTVDQSQLIRNYYQGEGRAKIQNRKRQALALGIPLNALRIRASRLRDRLEVCVIRCLMNHNEIDLRSSH